MDLKEIGISTRNWNWVDSAQDGDYWRALVNEPPGSISHGVSCFPGFCLTQQVVCPNKVCVGSRPWNCFMIPYHFLIYYSSPKQKKENTRKKLFTYLQKMFSRLSLSIVLIVLLFFFMTTYRFLIYY